EPFEVGDIAYRRTLEPVAGGPVAELDIRKHDFAQAAVAHAHVFDFALYVQCPMHAVAADGVGGFVLDDAQDAAKGIDETLTVAIRHARDRVASGCETRHQDTRLTLPIHPA